MAKKGALKSTLIVTSDELKVNGGRWLLQSGPAIRVRGFKESTIGDRKIIGGDALPIYVLAESDARVNGGQFLLKGGQPIQVTDVIGSARGVIQGKAIPVWPVDDDGNYDASFAGNAYIAKVLALNPIAYWVLGEAAGAVAVDQINSPAQDGTYMGGITLGQEGIGDGGTAPLFDGVNGLVDIFSAALDAVFNGGELTIHLWMRVFNAADWAAGAEHAFHIGVNTVTDYARLRKGAPNFFEWRREGSNVSEIVTLGGLNTLDWVPIAMTVSESIVPTGEVKAYWNGAQTGATQVTLGAYVGALNAINCCIGAQSTAPAAVWSGYLAHAAIWDSALSLAQIVDLGTIP